MRIIVFGHNGMLGKAVIEYASKEHTVYEFSSSRDIANYIMIEDLPDWHPDAVINCAGIVPNKRDYTSHEMVRSNAYAPHIVADVFDCPIIHVSTDCVFSGIYDEPYPVTFNPDPVDLYGRSKLVGEVKAAHVLNVRTSFIGFDHGLLNWLCSYVDYSTLDGWEYAWWSGSTVWAVAAELVKLASNFPGGGIAHLATEKAVSKLNVLLYLKAVLDLKVQIRPVMRPIIDRSLEPTIVLPDLMNEEVRKDLVGRYQRLYTGGAVSR